MDNNVTIFLKGKQKLTDNNDDVIELITCGNLTRKNGKYYITYKESEVTGMNGDTTLVKIHSSDMVSVTRYGKNSSQLMFQSGVRHNGQYATEYGGFDMSVNTTKVDADISDDGGKIDIFYSLEINHSKVSDNELRMKIIKEVNSDDKSDSNC